VLLVSWNVAGRAGQISEQLDAVVERAADVIALREISARTYGPQRAVGPLS
jgi:exonuclease III